MNESTIRGIVHLIEPTKTFGQKGFRKRLVVLEQDTGRFTNYLPVEFIHEGCDKVDELAVGDEVEVSIRLSGRKWQRDEKSEVKFFLSAEASEFTRLQGSTKKAAASSEAEDSVSATDDDEPPF
jgi:hypothetical protein